MRASVVIAAHNEGELLARTVGSVRDSLDGLEAQLVVVDDASTDGSVEFLTQLRDVCFDRFPQRVGVSRTKDRGARLSVGDVLVFLDAHCKPERGALRRLVEDVELADGDAIVTPRICVLDPEAWENRPEQSGHGYYVQLDTMDTGWWTLERLRSASRAAGRLFYETPTFQGCAVAIGRRLYEELGGFDTDMLSWGSEDVDLGVKCWLLGHVVWHDPVPMIGHRFQSRFERYTVPSPHVLGNQLRMARKCFSDAIWADWLPWFRRRQEVTFWQAGWDVFQQRRPSVERERDRLVAQSVRDEFWYGERFNLDWPRRERHLSDGVERAGSHPEPPMPDFPTIDPRPSASPPPSPRPSTCPSPVPSTSPAPSMPPPPPSPSPSPRP